MAVRGAVPFFLVLSRAEGRAPVGSGLDADADARCFYFLLLAGTVVSLIVIFFTLQVSRSILDHPAVRPLTDAALRCVRVCAGAVPEGRVLHRLVGEQRVPKQCVPFPVPRFHVSTFACAR